MQSLCNARSGRRTTLMLESDMSESCSSCLPAEQWVSALIGKDLDIQACYVGGWDHIGWVDRYTVLGHTTRQRNLAAKTGYLQSTRRVGSSWVAMAATGRAGPAMQPA